jgi:hypothetical protein
MKALRRLLIYLFLKHAALESKYYLVLCFRNIKSGKAGHTISQTGYMHDERQSFVRQARFYAVLMS